MRAVYKSVSNHKAQKKLRCTYLLIFGTNTNGSTVENILKFLRMDVGET